MSEAVADILSHTNTKSKTKDEFSFEEAYIRLRTKEGRIYSDDELLRLPEIVTHHRYYNEWQLRKRSAEKLRTYFRKKNKPLTIQEAGCGNGWLSRFLSTIPLSRITGTDINKTELLQAKRVFGHVPNLQFICGDFNSAALMDKHFDCIVFASCIQYFSSLGELISSALQKLKPGGEIHILDSPFYQQNELAAARRRTAHYFSEIGFAEMADNYFHHSLEELQPFNISMLHKPGFISRYIWMNKNPFPWICIHKQ